MKHASLFSGIGGFDLASHWMGWENIFCVEKDKDCHKVLQKNFPGVTIYDDIKEFNGEKYRGAIDIISGGFPCQPFSVAGKQAGKEDDRYLWPEMLRVIREVQPTWVVGENVSGIIPLALDQVLSDLENEGYTCQAFVIPACAVNAIHRRDRVWILAHAESIRHSRRRAHNNSEPRERKFCSDKQDNGDKVWSKTATSNSSFTNTKHDGFFTSEINRSTGETIYNTKTRAGKPFDTQGNSGLPTPKENVSNTTSTRLERATRESKKNRSNGPAGHRRLKLSWPISQPTICRGDDGVSYRLDDCRLITPKQRNNSLKQLGNAVVPQLVYEIFRLIERSRNN